MCGREYFGRVWTLAERMARGGRGERLSNWMPLSMWLGMIVDALLASADGDVSSDFYWMKLFHGEVRSSCIG